MKRKDLEKVLLGVKEVLRVERLIIQGKMEREDVSSLKALAEKGLPRAEYDYGLYFLICLHDRKIACNWFEKCKKHANEYLMSKLSIAYLLMKHESPQGKSE